MSDRKFLLADETETTRFAAALARCLPQQSLAEQAFVIHLSGDLGTGKTTLVRALLRETGIQGRVKSPSFTLLETYNSPKFSIYHFDLYRFSSPEQWFDAGFDDILADAGLMLLEWPEQAHGALASPDLHLRLQMAGDGERMPANGEDPATARLLDITAHTEAGRLCLSGLAHASPS